VLEQKNPHNQTQKQTHNKQEERKLFIWKNWNNCL